MSDATSGASPQAQPAQQVVRRSPRWMKILLVVSLALNLLAIGFAVAHVVTGPRFVSAGPAASLADARKLLWSLPRDRRRALREEFISLHEDEFRAKRREWRTARRDLGRVLARSDATDAEIADAFRTLGEAEARAALRWREVLTDMALRLSPIERSELARKLRRRHGHRPIGFHDERRDFEQRRDRRREPEDDGVRARPISF